MNRSRGRVCEFHIIGVLNNFFMAFYVSFRFSETLRYFPVKAFVMCLAEVPERSGLKLVTFNCLTISRTAILDTTIIQFVDIAWFLSQKSEIG